MAQFFINRPIFAWVLAIVIMLAGAMAMFSLPVAQYPSIAPPQIRITATYPGASAQTMQDTVTQLIEQQMTGIDGMLYMSSNSSSNGRASITITFDAQTDPDTAQVQVQNKLSGALSMLPQEVQRRGVRVAKASSDILLVSALVSEDPSITNTDLGDYAEANLVDPLSRVDGVGDINVFGSQYAMRVWLDPDKLASFGLMPSDVSAAIQEQNAQVSAGQLGARPYVEGQQLNATVNAQDLLTSAADFEKIIVRSSPDGAVVKLSDVARVERGSDSYNVIARLNGKPSAGIAFYLAPGANALDTAERLKARIAELENSFPPGVSSVIAFDTAPFVEVSIKGVVTTLVEAIILVFLVMYLFLQNVRATLIPTIAIPVVLLGTFGILAALGFSINTLTLFGLVLSIGLLVDDAIVVVENVERLMSEEGLSPKEAAQKSMKQITGALVGIGLVISAVLVPMAFFGGSTGVIYQQFSVTIVSSMALSVLVAIVLTPALCATMLKRHTEHAHEKRGFFGWFNRMFDMQSRRYAGAVATLGQRIGRMALIYFALALVVGWLFMRLPTSFLPDEDQGMLMTQVSLPPGAIQDRTLSVLDEVQGHFEAQEGENLESVFTIAGFSFGGSGQSAGMGFIRLKDWDERPGEANTAQAIAARAAGSLSEIRDAMAFAMAPPAIRGLGSSTGFDFYLQDRTGAGREALVEARNTLLAKASQDPRLTGVRPNGQDDEPQLHLDIDREKAGALGIAMSDINKTIVAAWGGTYINDFLDKGRIKRVYIQGEADSRMKPDDLDRWHVRNKSGEMVPFSVFSSLRWTHGSPRLDRYNGMPAMQIQGQAAPGVSSGEAMAVIEEMAASLPDGFGLEWTGMSYQERASGNQAPMLFALSILVVFLCLAALYESWSIPVAVLLVVPLGVLGALMAATGRGLNNDVYFQVGLLVTIGLACKNAIMIVEFARSLREAGHTALDAAVLAARLRLRPILMTSIAFGLGVVPLALATGAGSGSQNAIGTGVLGGTISATVLGIFFVPAFFVLVNRGKAKANPPQEQSKEGLEARP